MVDRSKLGNKIHDSVTFGKHTVVGEDVSIGKGSKVWHFVNLYGCQIGENCIISSFCEIGRDVKIGNDCKIECRAFIPTGVEIEDEVFIGPSVTFTNDKHPKAKGDWKITRTIVKKRASIGANSTIVCGITIGEGAVVGAGAVVTKDVLPYTLVLGNPARKIKNITVSLKENR
jgi:UDP-2-acetamido-3-amino-2,3-dideoxy-glucuronate N-acetyltransferase